MEARKYIFHFKEKKEKKKKAKKQPGLKIRKPRFA